MLLVDWLEKINNLLARKIFLSDRYFNKESEMTHHCSRLLFNSILPDSVQSVNFFGFQEVKEIMKPNFFSRVVIAAMVLLTLSGFFCPVSHFYLIFTPFRCMCFGSKNLLYTCYFIIENDKTLSQLS